jgi:uncharacterized SAM-binding protein YcdF (DUF218 family)
MGTKKRGRLRARWLPGAAVLVYVLLTATPAAYYFGAPLFTEADARPSDVIVLLSSGQIDQDWLTPDASQRLLGALKLYRDGYARAIVSSGSQHVRGLGQAELQAAWLERAGVPREALVIESTSTRTHESAIEVRRIMQRRGWRSAAVVTSQMDVPRVRLVFRKLGVPVSFLPVPEFKQPRGFDYFRSAMALTYHATYEYAGLIFYKWKGWI